MENIIVAAEEVSNGKDGLSKLLRAARKCETYIEGNGGLIPNYGDRYCHGETISTAFVESAVNHVMSKRLVKKQYMWWSEEGAHNLLQVRTGVLNNDLRRVFDRWYPALSGAAVVGPLARKAA